MTKLQLWPRLGSLIGILIGVLGLGLVIYRLLDGWPEVVVALADGIPLLFVAAISLGMLAMTSIGANWWVLLNRFGGQIGPTEALYRYFVGQLGKYIPGGVWPIVGRAEMASRAGVDRTTAYAATLLSLALTYLAALVTAACFFVLSGPAVGDWSWTPWVLLAVPTGLLAMHPSVLRKALKVLGRISPQASEIPVPTWSSSVALALIHIPAWVVVSAATYLAMLAIGGSETFGQVAFATCVSWFLGFVVVGLPGGLGVREASFMALAGSLDPPLAAAVALVARTVFVMVDLLGAVLLSAVIRMAHRKTEI